MENIDAQNAAKVETTKVEALTHESTEESNDEDHRERNEDSAPDDSEKIRGSASSSVDYSSVNIEDCSAHGTKRISVRSTRQNFFSIETFSPRYN